MLNKLSLYQTEQQLAYATMANQNNMQNMQNMMSRLKSNAQQALSYEDKSMQIEALKVIPVVDLYDRVMKSENPKTSFNDELCAQLLAWFKHRFFPGPINQNVKNVKVVQNLLVVVSQMQRNELVKLVGLKSINVKHVMP